jgi:hypothetical protein
MTPDLKSIAQANSPCGVRSGLKSGIVSATAVWRLKLQAPTVLNARKDGDTARVLSRKRAHLYAMGLLTSVVEAR